MVTGVHAMFYSPDAAAMRAFLRDQLQIACFDAGDGWLIFTPQVGEIGCHPSEENKHGISFVCDDISATVAELKTRGVEFTQDVEDWGFGTGTFAKAPGDATIMLYQPKYR